MGFFEITGSIHDYPVSHKKRSCVLFYHFPPIFQISWYLLHNYYLKSNRSHIKEHYRCHYTKSNPTDDHSNISSKNLQKQNFKPLGHYTCNAVWYLPFTNSPRKHTVAYHFSDLQEVYSGNRQIHTICQLQYLQQQVAMSLCNNSSDNKSY